MPVGKNTLHDYLTHLEDAFLVRIVSLHTASERQRMVNPRKAHPIDPGLISLYERTGRVNLGHALETAVFLELERRGCETDYLRTRAGFEVDFFVRNPEGDTTLIKSAPMSATPPPANAKSARSRQRQRSIVAQPRCFSRLTRCHRVRHCRSPCTDNQPSPGYWTNNNLPALEWL